MSDLELVVEELRGVEEKWERIGRQLKMSQEYLTEIHTTYSLTDNCLRGTISRWLQGDLTPGILISFKIPTWEDIIVALRKANEPQLADNLKAKYLPGELTTTTSSQYSLESQHGENEMM